MPGSVPERSWRSWIPQRRRDQAAISLGGDADTQAAIAGGIAEAFYRGVPEAIVGAVRDRLPPRFIEVIDAFGQAFPADAEP